MSTSRRRSTKATTASLKASLSSPAAVCPALDSSTNSARGTVARKCLTPSGLTTSDSFPRINRTGIVRFLAACSNFSVRSSGSSPGLVMNAGSQCQYQRPSRRRRFFLNPSGLRGFFRYGR